MKSGVRTALVISFSLTVCVCAAGAAGRTTHLHLRMGGGGGDQRHTHTGAPLSRIKRFHITKIIASMCEGRYGEHVTVRRGNLLKVALNSCHLHLN